MQSINVITGGGNLSLTGTLYAKWAPFIISGGWGGSYQAQFIGGIMQLSGPATLTLSYGSTFSTFGRANEVFLVE